jgi:Inosine-uridine preferring nucleoside hydrolase
VQERPGVVLLALGPLTNVAEVASQHPEAYRRLAAVHAMAGSVGGPVIDGVAEWNAAADPEALDTVLAAPTPLTLVPEDAVPPGTPDALQVPVADRIVATAHLPAWWDLATAAALVAPDAARAEAARWVLDPSARGRLVPHGHGSVRVVRSLNRAVLDAEYARTFSSR